MPAIVLDASETATGTIGREAFSQPAQGATLLWWFGAEYGTNYRPYLVKSTYINGDDFRFRGITLTDRTIEIGPTSATDYYSVDLSKLQYVYRDEPSSLYQIDPDGAKKYAILFLTDAYITSFDTSSRLAAARATGGPKYPQTAEAFMETRKELKALEVKYKKAFDLLHAISKHDKSVHLPELQQWLSDNAQNP